MEDVLKMLAEIKQSELMLEHHQKRLETLGNQIQTALVDFKADADAEQTQKLIHHLYWYQNQTPKSISQLTGCEAKRVWKIAGPTYISQSCTSCGEGFITEVESKNQKLSTVCNQCKFDDYQKNRTKVLTQYLGQNVPQDYDKYLRSKHWKNTRKKALERAQFQCQLCANQDSVLEVHHNNYGNLGKEESKDLIVLCRPCHRRFHTK